MGAEATRGEEGVNSNSPSPGASQFTHPMNQSSPKESQYKEGQFEKAF